MFVQSLIFEQAEGNNAPSLRWRVADVGQSDITVGSVHSRPVSAVDRLARTKMV